MIKLIKFFLFCFLSITKIAPTAVKDKRNHCWTLYQKRWIVNEAYSKEGNVRPTARKYGIKSAGQISRWKTVLTKYDIAEMNLTSMRSFGSAGRKLTYEDVLPQLRAFFNELRLVICIIVQALVTNNSLKRKH